MSTAITSTHQQDRAAQQKLVNARQHASAQGQQQGAAFAQLLSLACDEDTDLDALQLGGKLFGLPADEPAGDADTPSTARRKGGKGVATGNGDTATDGTTPEGLHPTAQANATLLALLAQAQGAPGATVDAAPATTTDTAAVDVAPQGSTAPALVTDAGAGATADTALAPAPAAASTEAPPADAAEKPVPGKAVRDLARQLGAAMNNGSTAPDHATHGGDKGVAWGRQPAEPALTGLAQWPSGLVPASGHAPASSSQGPAALPGAPRSAVADSDPAPAGDGADTAGTDQAAPVSSRSAGSDGQPPSGGLGGEALGGTEATDSHPSAEAAGSAADQWREQWAEAMDQMGQQVTYWVSQGGVRQATLRVGNGWQQAMDVKLSMKNGQAHIEFQTDHEAARSAIAEGGTEVLRDLLARSGIDLGQVSVGAQAGGGGGGGGDRSASAERGMPATASARPQNSAAGAPAGTALQPRRSGSTGLDLYV